MNLEKLLPKIEELRWRNHALGEVVGLTEVFRENKALFSVDSIYDVAHEMENDEGEIDTRLFYLYGFLLASRLEAVSSHIDDKVGRILTNSMVKVGDSEFPYNMAVAMITREEDRIRRVQLRDAIVPVHERINEFLLEKDVIVTKECESLNENYIETAQVVRLVDLRVLAKKARAFLNITEEVYKKRMDAFLQKRMGFGLCDARRYDIPRLFSGIWWKDLFPREKMVGRLNEVLLGMGLDPMADGRIRIDAEERPKKMPRAACFGIRIPTDVRLSVKPIGGFTDYDALFHEMGHAQHFANTDQKELEFRYMGSLAITETYAFTIEGLLEKPEILIAMTKMSREEANEIVRFKALKKLFVSRRYAAKLLYELEWHSGKIRDPMNTYMGLLGRAYGFPLEEADGMSYLIDHDDLFYSANYLVAWYLQVLLDRMLTKGFGEKWFQNKDVGHALTALWRLGQSPLPEDLANMLEGVQFDARDYANNLINRLGQ